MTAINDSSLRLNLANLQVTQNLLDQTQLRLATGRRVNSALDDATNFFAAFELSNEASDISNLVDNLGQNIQAIQEAQNGLDAITNLLEQAQTITSQAFDAGAFQPDTILSEQILADNPVAFFPLNETSGAFAVNQITTTSVGDGFLQNGIGLGAPELFPFGGETSLQFDGVDDRIIIPNSTDINLSPVSERTIELTFNADDTGPRQVLYEEGGGINSIAIYIEDGQVFFNVAADGLFGPFNVSTGIEAGETNHVALTFDAPSGVFRGFLNGTEVGFGAIPADLPPHSGGIGIGRLNGSTIFADGPQGGGGAAFQGRIANVAIYNEALPTSSIQERADSVLFNEGISLEFEQNLALIKEQIDQLSRDASFRGNNLLRNGTVTSIFSQGGGTELVTEGENITTQGLNLEDSSITSRASAEETQQRLQFALETVRDFNRTLGLDLGVISTREDFLSQDANIRVEGADQLTLADLNEESARALSLQAAQQFVFNTFSSVTTSRQVLLDILF